MHLADDSILKIIEIDVKPIQRVKYLYKQVKYISNDEHEHLVAFQLDSSYLKPGHAQFISTHNQQINCSAQFEQLFQAKSKASAQLVADLTPFKCTASLYTKSGHRLAYLDRLLVTQVTFVNQHWSCAIKFAPNSNSLLYALIESNIDPNLAANKKSDDTFSNENEPTLIKLSINSKFNEYTNEELTDEALIGQLPFIPSFYVQTKQVELPIVRSSMRSKDLSSQQHNSDHFNLIIQATHQVHSHLILTTNCPSLIKINTLLTSVSLASASEQQSSISLFTTTYDIVTSDEMFDLTTYSNLMQQHQGQLYVQVTCSLTQQVERIPIKFLFGIGDMSHMLDFKPLSHHRSSFFYKIFGWIFYYSPNQITSFLVAVSLFLITVLCFLRIRSPSYPSSAEQIAMNASAATAAAIAANSYRSGGVKEHSSFNPYRYFTSALDVSQNDYTMRQRNFSGGNSVGGSPLNKTRLTPTKQEMSFNNRSVYASPTQNLIDRSQVRLFSTDANVSPHTVHYNDSSYSRMNNSGFRSFHGNDSYSEND